MKRSRVTRGTGGTASAVCAGEALQLCEAPGRGLALVPPLHHFLRMHACSAGQRALPWAPKCRGTLNYPGTLTEHVQVVLSGRGRHLGTDVAWRLRCRPDGAFVEEARGEHLSFSWGFPGGAASCWEARPRLHHPFYGRPHVHPILWAHRRAPCFAGIA